MKHFLDTPFEIKDITESGNFVGIASVYNNVDLGDDRVMPGAFQKSLDQIASGDKKVRMLWQHRMSEPIGTYPVIKDARDGLECHGSVVMGTQRGNEAYLLMKAGALEGLSIGGFTEDGKRDPKTGVRDIKQFDLLEISPVTFAMNPAARILAVKSIEEIGDLSGAESYLREAGGISRSEAKAMVSRIAAIARREAEGDRKSAELAQVLQLLEKRRASMA